MPLFHRGRRDAPPAPAPADLAGAPILAHDRKGRLRRRPSADTASAVPVAHADSTLIDPAMRTYTYGGKQYAYYDPSFHYDRGHERNLSVHPNDVVDPYLRTHLKDIRRKAQHGQLGPNDPALARTLPPEDRLDLFEPRYMGRTSRRRFAEDEYYADEGETYGRRGTPTTTTRRKRESRSLGRDYSGRRERSPEYYHEEDIVSRYPRSSTRTAVGSSGRSSSLYRPVGTRSDSVHDETYTSRRPARSSSVPAQRYGAAPTAHTRLAYSTADALPYGNASRGTSPIPTSAAYGRRSPLTSASATHLSQHDHGAGYADLITDRTEPVVFHPTSGAGKGTLECDHGAHVPLGAKQSLPYNPNVPTTTTVSGPPLANRTLSAPVPATGVAFHRESLTAARVPGHTVLTRTGAGTYDRANTGGLRGAAVPTTTVAALDRANRIALAEAEANRPVSYTKVGPMTFVHDQDRRYGNQSRMATLSRARVVGAGRTHTTTEMAIMRSNAIASSEMAREQNSRRAVTKIGSLLTLTR